MDRGRKKAKKHRQDERVCWSLVMWLADVAGPSVSPAQRRVSPCRKWRVSPGDKLFLQNKEIIRKMTAGPGNRKPKGPGLGELPPSISWPRSASPSPPSEGKQRPLQHSSPFSVSHSISFLIFLFLSLICLSDTYARTHPPAFLQWVEEQRETF